jgi:hypothetical protein
VIKVHVQFSSGGRIYWTSAIQNPRALELLQEVLQRTGWRYDAYDDAGHAYVADGCLAIARATGTGPLPMSWGPAGKLLYCCQVAELPKATGKPFFVNDDFKIAGSCDDDEPRELRGPLPEEVAAHTPLITSLDVHGAPNRAIAHQPTISIQPLLSTESWLDRLLRWALGAPRGMEASDA